MRKLDALDILIFIIVALWVLSFYDSRRHKEYIPEGQGGTGIPYTESTDPEYTK